MRISNGRVFYITKMKNFPIKIVLIYLRSLELIILKKFSTLSYEISGGQKRVVIAMSLERPKKLIADEPTTSLDPITQKCFRSNN